MALHSRDISTQGIFYQIILCSSIQNICLTESATLISQTEEIIMGIIMDAIDAQIIRPRVTAAEQEDFEKIKYFGYKENK